MAVGPVYVRGDDAGLGVPRLATLVAAAFIGFLFLAAKYVEICWRNPDGGGVATLHRPRPNAKQARDPNDPASWGKVARNAACPCGSGKKYKHCHGRV